MGYMRRPEVRGGGLTEDGGLDIVVQARAPRLLAAPGPAVVFRRDGTGGGARRAAEGVLFDKLLVDCLPGGRASRLPGCKLAGGYRQPALARAFARIESACMYDKTVRKRF